MNPVVAEDVARILKADLPWQAFSGRRVLVTGAGGFLGAYLVSTLIGLNDSGRLESPAAIVALVRSRDRAEARLGSFFGRADFDLVLQDLADPADLSLSFDYLIHAASPAAPRAYLKDPVGTLKVNLLGTARLLDLARGAKGVLFLSSGEVYGETGDILLSEIDFGYLDPATVRACYGEGKRAAEALCVAHAAQHALPVKIVRPMHTYGPLIDLEDGRVFSDFVADILAGRDIRLKSDGSARRPFCYVADATEGFFRVLLTGAAGRAYNIANDEAVTTIRQLGRLLVEETFPEAGLKLILPGAEPMKEENRSPITGSFPDISRARAIGWRPKTGIVEGFQRTVRSFS